MKEVEQERHSADDLGSHLEFERLISDLSSRFLILPAEAVDSEIEMALGRLCDLLNIEMAALWQWSGRVPEVISPTHVFRVPEVPAAPEPMSQELYPWARGEMLAGRVIVVGTLADLPPEAAVDRETCRQLGIRSVLCLPLAAGGKMVVGALGLNCLRTERSWPDLLVKRLQLVAQIFTSALARKRYEMSLQMSEARFAAGAELAGLAFYEVDLVGRSSFVDDRFRQICGFPPDGETGLQALEFWLEHLHPADRERILEERRQLHAGELETLSTEYRLLHPTQGERWIHHTACVARRDSSGRAAQTYGVLRDITQSKHAEEERRDLAQRLIRAQEEERAMLARELHDDLTQRLAVLAIEVGRAELAAPEAANIQTLRSVREGLVRLSEDVHSLASHLHPSVLTELGLAEALRAESERLSRHAGIQIAMELEALPGVARDAALCLFRVGQESLNNVIRHSGAHAASIVLRRMDGGLLLAVHDDGVGFDPKAPGKRRSLGLASMQERVRLLNGTLDIESAPGQGASIVAWVPAEVEPR